MSRDQYRPLAAQGHGGIRLQLRPLEITALAQIGGKHYTRIGDLIRDLLRMALAPRVAALAEGRAALRHQARLRFDEKLKRNTVERTERRANSNSKADQRLVSDEPLVQMMTKVPVSDRVAFNRLAIRRGTTASALLREMVREAVEREVTANAPVAD